MVTAPGLCGHRAGDQPVPSGRRRPALGGPPRDHHRNAGHDPAGLSMSASVFLNTRAFEVPCTPVSPYTPPIPPGSARSDPGRPAGSPAPQPARLPLSEIRGEGRRIWQVWPPLFIRFLAARSFRATSSHPCIAYQQPVCPRQSPHVWPITLQLKYALGLLTVRLSWRSI